MRFPGETLLKKGCPPDPLKLLRYWVVLPMHRIPVMSGAGFHAWL